jgi:hypothetical protein
MASGRLGNPTVNAAQLADAYTVPTGYYAIANISFTNRNAGSAKIRLAMSTISSPAIGEYIEYDTVIVGNGVFERTGLVMQPGLKLVVYSDLANVGVTVYGIETSTT